MRKREREREIERESERERRDDDTKFQIRVHLLLTQGPMPSPYEAHPATLSHFAEDNLSGLHKKRIACSVCCVCCALLLLFHKSLLIISLLNQYHQKNLKPAK